MRLIEHGPYGNTRESEAVYSLGYGSDVEALIQRYGSSEVPLNDVYRAEIELAISGTEDAEPRQRNSWQMRGEFLDLQHRGEALVSFLNKWGVWNWSSLSKVGELTPLGSPLRYYAVPELVWERQTFYKAALSGKPKDWLTLHGSVPTPRRQLKPPFLATVDTLCSVAIETTITMDKLRDIPYRICGKEDCGRVFELRTKHEKQFCSHACAHLTSVRRGRAKKRAISGPAKERSDVRF